MHPSPERRPSIKALATLILSAGFGSAAAVPALLILVGSKSAQQEDADRRRLQQDIEARARHMSEQQSAAAATAQSLRAHDPDGAAQHIQYVHDLSQAALAEMKALLIHLRPQPPATIGLIKAIREQLEALRFRAGVTTELHHDPLPDEERLPPGAQETIFRVVQEALSNTAHHARVRHARLTLTQEMAEGRE